MSGRRQGFGARWQEDGTPQPHVVGLHHQQPSSGSVSGGGAHAMDSSAKESAAASSSSSSSSSGSHLEAPRAASSASTSGQRSENAVVVVKATAVPSAHGSTGTNRGLPPRNGLRGNAAAKGGRWAFGCPVHAALPKGGGGGDGSKTTG